MKSGVNIRHALLLLLLAVAMRAGAQPWAVKTNLLYDLTLTPNLGVERSIDARWSVGLNAGLNAWDIDRAAGTKWRHLLLSPYARVWRDSVYRRDFLTLAAVYSHFNVGHVHFPLGLYPAVRHERRQGDLVAVGVGYGRTWRLSRLFRLEAEAGLDVGYQWADRYQCGVCGTRLGDASGLFLMPRLAVSLVLHAADRGNADARRNQEGQRAAPQLPTDTESTQ